MMRPKETEIVRSVSRLLMKSGYINQRTEVQICEKFIDLVCWDITEGNVIAVEAKVSATSRAFEQASRYLYVADYVYVAMLNNSRNSVAKKLSKETGIGLILVRKDSLDRYYAKVDREPIRSKHKSKNLVRGLIFNKIGI